MIVDNLTLNRNSWLSIKLELYTIPIIFKFSDKQKTSDYYRISLPHSTYEESGVFDVEEREGRLQGDFNKGIIF